MQNLNRKFEEWCVNLTGLKDNPLAAQKITLLVLSTWLAIIVALYLIETDMNSLAGHVSTIANEMLREGGGIRYYAQPPPPP